VKPDMTFSLEELASASGLSPRGIRYYIAQGLLPRPAFRGTITRYDQSYLVRLRAIARLRKERLRLDAIRKRLAAASPEELLRLSGLDEAKAQAESARRALPEGFLGPYRPALAQASERWDRIPICPGVELFVRAEADAEALRVAHEIVATYGAPAGASGATTNR
jgi:DNA-binding transcriptional MerR regulator